MVAAHFNGHFPNRENRLLGHTEKNIFSANLAFMHAEYRLILCSPRIEQTACVDLIVNEHKINLRLLCIKTRFAKKYSSSCEPKIGIVILEKNDH